MSRSVGIIGHTGMVGSTVFNYFTKGGVSPIGHSLDSQNSLAFEVDIIFIAVPTPFNWEKNEYDLSTLYDVVSEINTKSTDAIVVIKSTIPVGTTDDLQEKYPKLAILFSPEFLSEKTAEADFNRPDRQILGYTDKSYGVSMHVLNMLPQSAYDVLVPAKEAELLKYINNMHAILSVIEANHYYDVCQKEGLDYDRVIAAAEASRWVGAPMGRQYHTIFHRGYRGAGGKCFPKDLATWVKYCQENDIDVSLFETTQDINNRLLKDQGISPKEAEQL